MGCTSKDGRDQMGRFRRGHSGNPRGRPPKDADFRQMHLDADVSETVLAQQEPGLLEMMPSPVTWRELIAARSVYRAGTTDDGLREANARLWPKTERCEVSYPEGIPAAELPEVDNSPEALRETIVALEEAGYFETDAEKGGISR